MKNLGRVPTTVNFQQAPTGRFDCDPKFRVFLTVISSERLSIGTPTVYVPVEGAECGLFLRIPSALKAKIDGFNSGFGIRHGVFIPHARFQVPQNFSLYVARSYKLAIATFNARRCSSVLSSLLFVRVVWSAKDK